MIIKRGAGFNSAISAGAEIHLSSVFPWGGKEQMLDVKGRRQKRRQIVCQVPESLIYQGSGA
jgi:hypothetical protein